MLKTEEIREICDKHHLTRMEVYSIRSQFAAMCQMSRDRDEQEREALAAAEGEKAKNKGKK